MDFQEVKAVDSQEAFHFFFVNLQEFLTADLTEKETLYVTSILANYALTSRSDAESLPVFASLSEIRDTFVFPQYELGAEILEIAGAQTLLFNGFFRDQMRRRHNVRFYDELGRGFFNGASQRLRDAARKEICFRVAENFPIWAIVCRDMSRSFRDNQYNPLLLPRVE